MAISNKVKTIVTNNPDASDLNVAVDYDRYVHVPESGEEESYIPDSEKGAPNGVATLGEDGKMPESQLPEIDAVKYTAQSLTEGQKAQARENVGAASAEQGAKADTALQSESDPTVPAWAKEPAKPAYTAAEVGAEPAFTKKSAFNKDFGGSAGTVTEGNDARLSDARTPTPHAHGNTDLTGLADWAKAGNKPTYTKAEVGLGSVENITNTERIAGLLYSPSYDPETHTLTMQVKGGNAFVVDLPLEALITNISLNEDNELVITFEDSNTVEVPLSALLVGVAKSVNGKAADSNGAVSLVLADIPGLTAALAGKEPAFTKNTAFNKNFGNAAGAVCEGNDSRLSNARPASGGNADTVDNKHASDFATAAQGAKADTALQSETDPTVPSWAKQPAKPAYTPAEVGAAPASHTHPAGQVTGLAAVATSGAYDDLSGKPTIPAEQVNADWNASSGKAQILNKPTIPDAQIQSDWNQSNTSAKDYIKNKPTIPTVPSIASQSEAETGTDNAKMMTALRVKQAIDEFAPATYDLPTASDTVLGGVKVGNGLSITDGVLSAEGGTGTIINVEVLGDWG